MNHLNPIDKTKFERYRNDPDFMLSLARGVCVLLAFSERKVPLSIADLARTTGFDRAVVRRCLYTLTKLGLVEQRGRRHALSSGVLNLGHAYFSSSRVVVESQVHLNRLGEEIHTNCALAMMNGFDVVYLSRFQSTKLIEKHIGMGSRLPAYCTSVGRVLLSQLDDSEIEAYLGSVELRRFTQFTIVDHAQLREALEEVRSNGYCIIDQEYELGLSAIAIPVRLACTPTSMALSVTVNAKYYAAAKLKDIYLDKMSAVSRKLAALGEAGKPGY